MSASVSETKRPLKDTIRVWLMISSRRRSSRRQLRKSNPRNFPHRTRLGGDRRSEATGQRGSARSGGDPCRDGGAVEQQRSRTVGLSALDLRPHFSSQYDGLRRPAPRQRLLGGAQSEER